MKLIDEKLESIGAKYIKYKHVKGTNITRISYKLGKEKKEIEIDGGEIEIKVFRLKEKYAPDFQKYKEELDEAQRLIDEKYKPIIENYKEETRVATLSEIERQLEKALKS